MCQVTETEWCCDKCSAAMFGTEPDSGLCSECAAQLPKTGGRVWLAYPWITYSLPLTAQGLRQIMAAALKRGAVITTQEPQS